MLQQLKERIYALFRRKPIRTYSIEELKMMTCKPPIFSSLEDVKRMRVEAQSARAFGVFHPIGTIGGHVGQGDRDWADMLDERANRLEREIFIHNIL